MHHKHSSKPKKFSFIIVFILVALILGTMMMNMDVQPQQTLVEEELDGAAFAQN